MTDFPDFETAPIVRPHNRPLPDAIRERARFYYVQHNDIRLRVMLARPETEDPRGTIIFCPGRTEFIEKYFETIEDFLARDFVVLMLDPRGQGLSDRMLEDGLKSYVKRFEDYPSDLAFVIRHFADYLPKPHILGGHSMGGCIALHGVISRAVKPDAVIVSAPMLGLFDVETSIMSYIIRFAAKIGFANKYLPFQNQDGGLPVPFKGNKLTSDENRFRHWAAFFETTPALRVAAPTISWAVQAFRGMEFVNKHADTIDIPGLVIAAGGDPIVDPASNERFARNSGLDYYVVPGALHEVFLERDRYRNQFLDVFDAFLERNAL